MLKIPSFHRKSKAKAGRDVDKPEGESPEEKAPVTHQSSLADFTGEAALEQEQEQKQQEDQDQEQDQEQEQRRYVHLGRACAREHQQQSTTKSSPLKIAEQPLDSAPQRSALARNLSAHGIIIPKGFGRRKVDRSANGDRGEEVEAGDTNEHVAEEGAVGGGVAEVKDAAPCIGDTALSVMGKLEEMVQSTTMLFKQMQQWQAMEEEAEAVQLAVVVGNGGAPVPPPKPAYMKEGALLSTAMPETAAVSAELNELSRRRRGRRRLEQVS
jgi:hypothetical protein